MSKYTTELRYLIETGYDLGMTDYPIYDEAYRAVLNQKIISHYYFREIGFETAALFKYYLNTSLNEIMPYYNQLYKSALLELDPLTTHKMVEEYSRTFTEGVNRQGTANQTGNATKSIDTTVDADGKSVYSDFPQSMLPASAISGIQYASNATVDENTTNTDSSENTNMSQDTTSTDQSNTTVSEGTTRKSYGYDGDVSELLLKYRQTFLNIDMQVINELNSLFMGLW